MLLSYQLCFSFFVSNPFFVAGERDLRGVWANCAAKSGTQKQRGARCVWTEIPKRWIYTSDYISRVPVRVQCTGYLLTGWQALHSMPSQIDENSCTSETSSTSVLERLTPPVIIVDIWLCWVLSEWATFGVKSGFDHWRCLVFARFLQRSANRTKASQTP